MSLRSLLSTLVLSLVTVVAASSLGAQVPSFAEVTGHQLGERITQHHQTLRFFERLAATSPRVTVEIQGETWEGRPLPLAIVTSPANHARLAEIRAGAARLGGGESDADLLASQPAIVWLGGSIHGFELSGTEGLLKLLERLATAEDPATLKALDQTVVLIDPTLNPDGRDAFAQANAQLTSRQPNPRRDDWNNDWSRWDALRFRTGHYFFDNNRDWFAHTQPETRYRVPTWVSWRPQVVIDAHEMGSDQEFFFDPPTAPFAPHFPAFARRWFERFGSAYAAAFDSAGFEYTQRQLFNYYYPGYSTSFGSHQGAVGMLYEQGSSRGLAMERADGSVRTLANALEQQYTAAWTAVRIAADQRAELLRDYAKSRRQAIASGRQGVRRYFIGGGDPNLRAELANILRRGGIEVRSLRQPTQLEDLRGRDGADLGDFELAAGTLVIDAAQPNSALIRTLLEPEIEMPAEFLEAARRRLDQGENPRFYDITAWSLPLLFNLQAWSTEDDGPLSTDPLPEDPRGAIELPTADATYAYIFDGSSAASVAIAHQLKQLDFRATTAGLSTRIDDRDIPSGSVVVRVSQNEPTVHAAVRQLAERYKVDLWTVTSGAGQDQRPALGAVEGLTVQRARIAILSDSPVNAYSFGWAWHKLDRQYELPTTVLRAASLAATPLDDFDSLVIPDLNSAEALADLLGEKGRQRLKTWVEDGGNVVALGQAVDFARHQLGLEALTSPLDSDEGEQDKRRFAVPGAILRAELDSEDWMTAGYNSDQLPFLIFSDRVYNAPTGPPKAGQKVIVACPEQGDPRLSGHLWPESTEMLRGAVLVYRQQVGQGQVIAFAEDTNFRGFWRGTDRLFLNAVVLGPSTL